MRALNRYADTKRNELITASVQAHAYAEANPGDQIAQHVASLCGDAALAGRKLADFLRYNRADY